MVKEGKVVIGIMGPIASGKSTLCRNLATYLDGKPKHELNPEELGDEFKEFYLHLHLKPNPFCYPFERKFLNRSLEQMAEIEQEQDNIAVIDMPPVGHMMYMYLNMLNLNVLPETFQDYYRVFVELVSQSFHPNVLLMVINKDMNSVKQRLIQRAEQMSGRAPEIEALAPLLDLIARQTEYTQTLATNRLNLNYPFDLVELNRAVPQIPMILLHSDQEDWTTIEAAGELYEKKVLPKLGILEPAA